MHTTTTQTSSSLTDLAVSFDGALMKKIAFVICLAMLTVAMLLFVSCKDDKDGGDGDKSFVDPSEWEDSNADNGGGDSEGGVSGGDITSPVRGDAANPGAMETPVLPFPNN